MVSLGPPTIEGDVFTDGTSARDALCQVLVAWARESVDKALPRKEFDSFFPKRDVSERATAVKERLFGLLHAKKDAILNDIRDEIDEYVGEMARIVEQEESREFQFDIEEATDALERRQQEIEEELAVVSEQANAARTKLQRMQHRLVEREVLVANPPKIDSESVERLIEMVSK